MVIRAEEGRGGLNASPSVCCNTVAAWLPANQRFPFALVANRNTATIGDWPRSGARLERKIMRLPSATALALVRRAPMSFTLNPQTLRPIEHLFFTESSAMNVPTPIDPRTPSRAYSPPDTMPRPAH